MDPINGERQPEAGLVVRVMLTRVGEGSSEAAMASSHSRMVDIVMELGLIES